MMLPRCQQTALGVRSFNTPSKLVYVSSEKVSRHLHVTKAATKTRSQATSKATRLVSKQITAGNASKTELSGLSTAYLAVASLSTGLGVACTFIPEALWSLLLGHSAVSGADPVLLASTRLNTIMYGTFLWSLVPTASCILAAAAKQGDLDSLTNQRLNLFLGLYFAGAAAVLAKGIILQDYTMTPGVGAISSVIEATSAAAAPAVAVLLLLAASMPYWAGYVAGSGSTDLSKLAAGLGLGLKASLKTGNQGWARPFYNLFFWEAIIIGTAYLTSPINAVVADQALASAGTGAISKDLVGLGPLLNASVTWLLLDALDKKQLGLPAFRALNAACGVLVLPLVIVTGMIEANGIEGQPANQAVVYVSGALTAVGYLYLAATTPEAVEKTARK